MNQGFEKRIQKITTGLTVAVFFLSVTCLWASDIDMSSDFSGASSTVTPVPESSPEVQDENSIVANSGVISSTPSEELDLKAQLGQGILKMEDVYKAGIVYYRNENFAAAIRFLKKSLEIHDPYTPKYYYAEANAMLGVIYQFHIIDKAKAYQYYLAALKIDSSTATAKRHIRQVRAYAKADQ